MSETIENTLEYALGMKKTAIQQTFESGLIDDLEHLVWYGVISHPEIQVLSTTQMSNRTYGFMYKDLLFSFSQRETDIKQHENRDWDGKITHRFRCELFAGESKVLSTIYHEKQHSMKDENLWTSIEFSDDLEDFKTVILRSGWVTPFQEAMALMREGQQKLDRAKEIAKAQRWVEELKQNYQCLEAK